MDIREQILKTQDRRYEEVDCPEWGVTLRVYSLSARDAQRIEQMVEAGLPDTAQAEIVYMCACDETGTRIFHRSDIDALADKSAAAVGRIATTALRLSKVTQTPEALAEKNSEQIDNGSGGIE